MQTGLPGVSGDTGVQLEQRYSFGEEGLLPFLVHESRVVGTGELRQPQWQIIFQVLVQDLVQIPHLLGRSVEQIDFEYTYVCSM